MVATWSVVPVLMAVNAAMFPVPLAARPILVLLLVQLYTVPAIVPVKFTGAVCAPGQTDWLAGWLTVGVGLTVIVNVVVAPVQVVPPLVKVGVTTIVPVIGAMPAFVDVKDMLPVPLAPKPMAVLLLVQLYTVPGTEPLNVAVVTVPGQTVWLGWAFTVGTGLTVIVKFIGAPVQVVPALV